MVLWGYAEGSRLVRPLSLQFKQGLKEWPELYMMLAHMVVGIGLLCKKVYDEEKNHMWTSRYKKVYTVFRPYDQRLHLYPKPWVTDSEYLPADHPMSTKEIGFFMFPPVEVHRDDPKIRGPICDGKEYVAKPYKWSELWKWHWNDPK